MNKDDIILTEVTYGRRTLADLFAPRKRKIMKATMQCRTDGMKVYIEHQTGVEEHGYKISVTDNRFYSADELRELSVLADALADLLDGSA